MGCDVPELRDRLAVKVRSPNSNETVSQDRLAVPVDKLATNKCYRYSSRKGLLHRLWRRLRSVSSNTFHSELRVQRSRAPRDTHTAMGSLSLQVAQANSLAQLLPHIWGATLPYRN